VGSVYQLNDGYLLPDRELLDLYSDKQSINHQFVREAEESDSLESVVGSGAYNNCGLEGEVSCPADSDPDYHYQWPMTNISTNKSGRCFGNTAIGIQYIHACKSVCMMMYMYILCYIYMVIFSQPLGCV